MEVERVPRGRIPDELPKLVNGFRVWPSAQLPQLLGGSRVQPRSRCRNRLRLSSRATCKSYLVTQSLGRDSLTSKKHQAD